MKFLKIIAAVALTSTLLISCKKEIPAIKTVEATPIAPKAKQQIAVQNLQTASFTVEGMTCAVGCAKTIEGELSNLDGVQKATVDFDKKLATVTFDKTIQNQESLIKVVQATGDGKTYTVPTPKS